MNEIKKENLITLGSPLIIYCNNYVVFGCRLPCSDICGMSEKMLTKLLDSGISGD